MTRASARTATNANPKKVAPLREKRQKAPLLGPGLHAATVERRTQGGFAVRTLDGTLHEATVDAAVEEGLMSECLRHGRRVLVADGSAGPLVLGALQTTRTVGYERDGSLRVSAKEIGLEAEGQVRIETGSLTLTLDPDGALRIEGNKMIVDMATLVRFVAARLELPLPRPAVGTLRGSRRDGRMGKSKAGKKNIATMKSDHIAPGPPAMSAIAPPPPPAPTGPWPVAPFMYIARSKKAQADSCSVSDKEVEGGARCLIDGSAIDIEQPGNFPSTPSEPAANKKDLVSKAIVGIGYVQVPNNSDTTLSDKNPAVTGATIFLNLPGPKQKPHQSESKLLDGAGALAAGLNKKKNPCKVIATGDPVAVVSGDVIDDAEDLYSPGIIDVVFGRAYASGRHDERGPLGAGWRHSFEQWVTTEDGQTVAHVGGGTRVPFAVTQPGDTTYSRTRQMQLTRLRTGYELWSAETRETREFAPLTPGGPAVLRAIRDAWGNRVEVTYEDGRLARIVDTAKRELRLHYRESRIVRVELWARGQVHQHVTYDYDAFGDLVAVTDAMGQEERYGYDAKHRLVSKRLKGGTTFRYTYEADGERCIRSQADGGLQNVELIFDEAGTTLVSGTPEPIEFTYDEKGDLLCESTFDKQSLARYEYDDDQLVVATENAAGHRWEFTYDARGNLIEKKLPGGRGTTFAYQDDLLVEATDAGGRTTRMTYDDRGALTMETSPAGRRQMYAYDNNGRLVGEFNDDGRISTLEWDEEHNLVCARDAQGAAWRYTYDALGRVVAAADPLGQTTRQEYDALGRLVSTTMPDGTLIEYTHAADQVARSRDTTGVSVESEFGGTGQLVRRRSKTGDLWHFKYDVLERLREVRNPKDELYAFRYDRSGRVVEEQTFDGQRIRYAWGRNDLLTRIEYEDETFVELDYDASRMVVAQRSSHGAAAFEWDDRGFLVKETLKEHDGETVIENEWDPDGLMLSETVDGRTIRYTYDRVGNQTSRTLPNGQTTRYFYDPDGLLIGIDHEGERVHFTRDALGRVERRYSHGSGLDLRWVHDVNSHPTELHALIAETPIVQRRWEYGAHSRLSAAHDSRWGTTRYRHDVGGRLLTAVGPDGEEDFQYDPAGSIVGTRHGAPRWTTLAGNVLVGADETSFTNDVRGRRRARRGPDGETTYVWDCEGRLREITLPTGTLVRFSYDTRGRRTKKVVLTPSPDDKPFDPPAIRQVDYVWDDGELAMEIDSERGERVFVHEPGTFVPVLQREGGETYTYVTDPLGQPRDLFDGRGRVVWSSTTSAFGKVARVAPDAPATSSPFRLLGHYCDEETGLFYAWNRYFDPDTARWLSPDPLGFDGGTNLFAFDGSPTERVDPVGLMTATEFKKWLKKTHAGRKKANAAAKQRQAKIKRQCDAMNARRVANNKKPMGVYAQKTAGSKVNGEGKVITRQNGGDPDGRRTKWGDKSEQGKPLHAEEKTKIQQGDYSGAGRPHCGNCTEHIMAQGGVTSSPIEGTKSSKWEPNPTPDNAGNQTWGQPDNSPP